MNQKFSRNLYQNEWKSIENEKTQPRFLRKILSTSYKDFSEKVLEQDPAFVKKIVESLYSGDVYILKNAFKKKYLLDLQDKLHHHGKITPSSFHKMLDECPDFHRAITPELAKNYALRQIKHAYYFFPWNNDPFKLFKSVNKRWRVLKFLGGFPLDAYEKNVPSTGVVDRLQVVQYTSGVGELEVHSDPYLYQKTTISAIMSKKGKDYNTGGAYILNRSKEKVDVEGELDIGDIYLTYPTVFHGVETVDKGREADWSSPQGRWLIGLYSNASDTSVKRHTVYGVEDTINSGITKIQHPY